MYRKPIICLFGCVAAMSCAPVPMTQERATRECRADAGLADGVQGTVAVGTGSGGPAGKAGITVTNRVFNPQTEAEFMSSCIARKMAGQPEPTTVGISIGRSL